MDVLFHLVSGLMLAKIFQNENVLAVLIFSVLPDLLGAAYFNLLCIKNAPKKSLVKFIGEWKRRSHFYGTWDKFAYRITHSIVGWVFITSLAYLFLKNFEILSLAYLIHILIDLPTHEGEISPRLFYPFHDWSIHGLYWATNIRILFLFWACLMLLMVYHLF